MNRVDDQSWKARVDAGPTKHRDSQGGADGPEDSPLYVCDRCGSGMFELNCKVICPNCGSRFDCSDLSVYFDKPKE